MLSHIADAKGRLPNGDARGGQRYGRPQHPAIVQRRFNAALTPEAAGAVVVTQWVCPMPTPGPQRICTHTKKSRSTAGSSDATA